LPDFLLKRGQYYQALREGAKARIDFTTAEKLWKKTGYLNRVTFAAGLTLTAHNAAFDMGVFRAVGVDMENFGTGSFINYNDQITN
jgi:hypothetical protein